MTEDQTNQKSLDGDTALNIDPYDMLRWHIDMGADEAIGDDTVNWFETTPELSITKPAAQVAVGAKAVPAQDVVHKISDEQVEKFMNRNEKTSGQSDVQPVAARPVMPAKGASPEEAEKAAASANTAQELYDILCNFEGGHIKRSSRSTVFSDGILGADIMLVGESPGIEEDKQGKPFIGPAGDMLDAMLKSIGLSRAENCYITNLLPWRVMGKPTPTPEMVAMCLPFLKRHIELAKPKIVVTLGKVSAQALLGCEGSILKFHGKWQDLTINDQTFAAIPTYRPSYLVKAPLNKKQAWQDLLSIKQRLKEVS